MEPKYDIFLSYERVQNKPAAGATAGWVDNFVYELNNQLARKIGKGWDEFLLYFDKKERKNFEPLEDELLTHAANSKIFLCVVSEGYMKSEWCQRELEAFLGKGETSQGNLFLISLCPCDRLQGLREELKKLSPYEFWEGDPRRSSTLGYPMPKPEDGRWHNKIENLAYDIRERYRPDDREPENQIHLPKVYLYGGEEDKDFLENTSKILRRGRFICCKEMTKPSEIMRMRRKMNECTAIVMLYHKSGEEVINQFYNCDQYQYAIFSETPPQQFLCLGPGKSIPSFIDDSSVKVFQCKTDCSQQCAECVGEAIS